MKIKYKIVILNILMIVTLGMFFQITTFAQSQDQVIINFPKHNTAINISDEIKIEWIMTDDNQAQEDIDFQIALSPDSCQVNSNVTHIIATDDSQIDIDVNVYVYKWDISDTDKKQQLKSGEYCLQICGTLTNPNNELYGVCDKKDIVIETKDNVKNSNNIPIIVSQPKNLNIKTGNKYSYQVVAQDSDKDKLYYYMSIGPEFITIDENTGLLTSVGGLIKEGLYEIKIVVQDNKGGWDEQLFIIKISDKPFYDLNFIEPNKHTTFSGSETNVIWSISPTENIENINLAYSKDGIRWINIDTLESDKTEYMWDISNISSDSYYIKLLVTDKSGELYEVIGDRFNLPVIQKNNNEISLTIDYPKDGTLISEVNPTITFIATKSDNTDININDINVKLGDTVLTCTYEKQLVSCPVTNSLTNGEYTINVEVKNSSNKMKSLSWSFTLGEEISGDLDTTSMFSNISKASIYLAGIILCIGIAVLVVSWFIYYKKRNSNKQVVGIDKTTNNIVEEYDNTPIVDNFGADEVDSMSQTSFTHSIGEQTLGDDIENDNYGVDVDTESSTINDTAPIMDTTDNSELSMPSSYSNEEIPEWLKDFESDQPKTTAGEEYSSGAVNINAGAKVHDDYGITLNTDDGSKDKK